LGGFITYRGPACEALASQQTRRARGDFPDLWHGGETGGVGGARSCNGDDEAAQGPGLAFYSGGGCQVDITVGPASGGVPCRTGAGDRALAGGP
jgi:hypothetical protein